MGQARRHHASSFSVLTEAVVKMVGSRSGQIPPGPERDGEALRDPQANPVIGLRRYDQQADLLLVDSLAVTMV